MSITNVQFKIEKIKDTENYANRWDTFLKFTNVGFYCLVVIDINCNTTGVFQLY